VLRGTRFNFFGAHCNQLGNKLSFLFGHHRYDSIPNVGLTFRDSVSIAIKFSTDDEDTDVYIAIVKYINMVVFPVEHVNLEPIVNSLFEFFARHGYASIIKLSFLSGVVDP
jgi:hypothetical protein